MTYIIRQIGKNIQQTLERGKSVLLLGARQTGKTTLITQQIQPDISYSFARADLRQRLPQKIFGDLFEQYVGNELVNQSSLLSPNIKVKYWRDTDGPEVDFVLDVAHRFIPIQVKWSDKPGLSDAKHLIKFLDEYPEAETAYVVCRTPRRYKISDKITALPWEEIKWLVECAVNLI